MPKSAQKIDENGFREIKGCPISSYGIFDYSAGQLGLPGDANRIVKVFRSENEVNSPEFLQSFNNKPFIIDHTMMNGQDDEEGDDPDNVGVRGVLTNVRYEKPWVRGDVHVFSRKAQSAIDKGYKDLSLGYSCTFDQTPGVFEGQPYEVVQRNMRGNHIALVEEGRVPGARVLDGRCFDHLSFEIVRPSDKELTMPKAATQRQTLRARIGDNAVEQLKALLPALQQFLSEEATEPAHQDTGAEAGAEMNPPAPPMSEGEPGAADNEGGHDIAGLITEIEGILGQLKQAAGGEGAATTTEGDVDPGTGEASAVAEGDHIEGLQSQTPAGELPEVGDEAGEIGGGQGKASAGPKAGTNATAEDASLGRFYSDFAAKNRLYDRLSQVVGAFDHAAMDASAVARYGVATLKKKGVALDCKPGTEQIALDAYLKGVEAGNKQLKTAVAQRNAAKAVGDAAAQNNEVAAYLKGKK